MSNRITLENKRKWALEIAELAKETKHLQTRAAAVPEEQPMLRARQDLNECTIKRLARLILEDGKA